MLRPKEDAAMATTVLVGTTKGAFLVGADDGEVRGPFCDGWPINHVVADQTTGDIFAAGGNGFFGAGIFRSSDQGKSWHLSKLAKGDLDDWAAADPDMAKMFGYVAHETHFDGQVDAVWSLHADQGRVWAGVKPANLFASDDAGASWAMNDALSGFEGREDWNPGAAGLILHTIVQSPDDTARLWLGVSAAGVFATEDGGASWERRNRMSNADHAVHHHHPAAPSGGETGHCVHNIQRAPGAGDVLYQQNHHGVFRSPDGGRSWDDVTDGLPSHFGFPMGVHPEDPNVIWTLPLNGDAAGRYPPDASAAVWKSVDGGQTWTDKREGLPQGACYFTVLRQAMAVGQGTPARIWFGTNTGSIFASDDEGESWSELARHLPTVLSVEVLETV